MPRWMLTALLACAAALAPALAPTPAHAGPGTLAILYFENTGNPELEPLKVGLAQMLITDLKGTPGLTVVERAQLQAILDELELGHSGVADPDTAAQVGKLLGAEWMLLGSYFELLGTLRIDARLVRVETGEIVHAHGVNDASAQFMEMEKALAASFGEDLARRAGQGSGDAGGGPTGFAGGGGEADAGGGDALADGGPAEGGPAEGGDTPTTRGGASDGAAADPGAGGSARGASDGDEPPAVVGHDRDAMQAAMAFSEGLIFLDRKDATRAREAFQQAVTADPQLDAAREALSSLEI